jgi:glycosyltransferase involved in cell wall biosynthesis
LLRILTDHDLRHRLARGARARAEQFSTAAVVPRIEQVYASIRRDH